MRFQQNSLSHNFLLRHRVSPRFACSKSCSLTFMQKQSGCKHTEAEVDMKGRKTMTGLTFQTKRRKSNSIKSFFPCSMSPSAPAAPAGPKLESPSLYCNNLLHLNYVLKTFFLGFQGQSTCKHVRRHGRILRCKQA